MGLVIEIKVIPQSKKQVIGVEQHGLIKCYLKSQPEKGKANEELITMLSKQLRIPKQDIKILSGHTSRKKIIKINDDTLTLDGFFQRCNIPCQKSIS